MMFPAIDPVAIEIGPLVIRWYALAYVVGLLGGWWLMQRLARVSGQGITSVHVADFLVWAVVGVIVGGRLGYVLFYKPDFYLSHPLSIVKTWEGGMSFHGGFLGVVVATILFCRRYRLPPLALGDLVAVVAPIGLFLGRLANFVNGELWGRVVTGDVPWAMVFPGAGPLPRHPSQLYEAALEGAVLFVVMAGAFTLVPRIRAHVGALTGLFLTGYGCARFIVEFFREPDEFLGFLVAGATMGQLLSVPMILAGSGLMIWALRRPPSVVAGSVT